MPVTLNLLFNPHYTNHIQSKIRTLNINKLAQDIAASKWINYHTPELPQYIPILYFFFEAGFDKYHRPSLKLEVALKIMISRYTILLMKKFVLWKVNKWSVFPESKCSAFLLCAHLCSCLFSQWDLKLSRTCSSPFDLKDQI